MRIICTREATLVSVFFFFVIHFRARWGTEPYVALLESMFVNLFNFFLPLALLSPSVRFLHW